MRGRIICWKYNHGAWWKGLGEVAGWKRREAKDARERQLKICRNDDKSALHRQDRHQVENFWNGKSSSKRGTQAL